MRHIFSFELFKEINDHSFLQIPHEIGDYAILIQSGVSPMKAKLLQSLTAIGALLGCIVALVAQGKQSLEDNRKINLYQ